MILLKKFDFFQKISLDNITQPTLVGSLLSISALVLMIFLLVKDYLNFITPSITKESIVLHDKDQKSKISINLGIRFPKVPCHIISVDQEDSVGNHRMNIGDTIIKNRLNKVNNIINEPLKGYIQTDELTKALENEEGCLVSGYVPVTKVVGDIHISFHHYADLFNFVRLDEPKLFEKISLNHEIIYLNFGEIGYNDQILKRFKFDDNNSINIDGKGEKLGISFNNPKNIPNFIKETKRKNYDYYVKLIPHIFDDTINEDKAKIGYQYSMTSRSRDYNHESYEMPIVIINYDFSPITMRYTLKAKPFLHFLTHLCAIVGGVFIMFNILNNMLLKFFDFDKA